MSYQQSEPRQSPIPGHMTAVMRAAAPTGPKSLRIGIVQFGHFVEERIIKQHQPVTIGSNESNLFVIATDRVPSSFRLFESVGEHTVLNFVDTMSGRVAVATGIDDLSALKTRATCSKHGIYRIELGDEARGKLVIGNTTLLFQFVALAPPQAKPQLPAAVWRGPRNIDWTTTMVATFSFLLHFMAVGSLYSDWLDPMIDDDENLANLVDTVRSLPIPPPVEQKADSSASPDSRANEKAMTERPSREQGAATNPARGNRPMNHADVANLTKTLDELEMRTLGALKANGQATQDVLRRGDVTTDNLDAAARRNAGIGSATDGLKLPTGGDRFRVGPRTGGIEDFGNRIATDQNRPGAIEKVTGPKVRATVQPPTTSSPVPRAANVIAQMTASFRRCYTKELEVHPDASGTVRLTLKVGPGGEVQSASAAASGNLGSAVECVRSRATRAQFEPPEGGSAVIVVPVTFVKQQ